MTKKTFTNDGQGRVYTAPADTAVGTTFAAIAAAVVKEPFVDLGHIHKDGLTVTPRNVDSSFEDMNGVTLDQTVSHSWAFKAIDFVDPEPAKVAFGASNVTGTSAAACIEYDGDMPDPCVFVAVFMDGERGVAEVMRNGRCTGVGDVKYTKGEYSCNDVTLTAEKPSDGKSCCYRVTSDTVASTNSAGGVS